MSSDSTKMDASTELDAVLAFAIVNGSCEARPVARAALRLPRSCLAVLATAPYGGAVPGAQRRSAGSGATLRERGYCEGAPRRARGGR